MGYSEVLGESCPGAPVDHFKALRALLATLALLPLASALAADPINILPSDQPTRELPLPGALPSPQGQSFGTHLDYWHDRLFIGVQDRIEQLDARFALDQPDRLPVPVSPFRIGLDSDFISHPGGTAISPRLDVDLQLEMPNLERRLHLFITSDSVAESPHVLGRDSSALRAGLRLTPLRYLDFDIGVRADVPPYAFTSVRWQSLYGVAGFSIQPFVKLYAETQRGLGLASGITLDRWMGTWVARSSTYGNWLKDKSDTEWTQALIVAHAQEVLRLGRYSDLVGGQDVAHGYGVQLLAAGTHDTGVQRYEAGIFYKHRTRTQWLYWHVTPLLRWERQFNWHPDPGINIGVDALFWNLSTP